MKTALALPSLARAKKSIFEVSVLLTLALIGLWGHKTHWSLSSSHASDHAIGPVASASLPSTDSPVADHLPVETGPGAAQSAEPDPRQVRFPSDKAVQDLGLQLVPVQRRPLAREVSALGDVMYEPSKLAKLSARCTGSVWRVEKQVGQSIRAGDPLAIIDAAQVGQAKADCLRAIADVRLREKAFERLKSFDQGVIAKKHLEEAETELQKARVDLFNAQQALISLGFPVDVDKWEHETIEELEQRIKFLGLSESLVAQLDPNATTANLLPVFAPFDGLVIGRAMSLGEVVSPSDNQFEVADVSKMWIVLNVREQDADELELGQKVVFTAGNVSVVSSLSWMSTAIDEKTRTIEVRCETDNPEIMNSEGKPTGKRLLRANVFGVGKIQVRESSSAVVVPTKAVQGDAKRPIVFVPVDAQTFVAREVRCGIVNAEYTEILEGLSDSDSVVALGSHILKAELSRVAKASP